jgi:hypothetical protein
MNPQPAAPGSDSDAANRACLGLLQRLQLLLNEESESLSRPVTSPQSGFTERKNAILRELYALRTFWSSPVVAKRFESELKAVKAAASANEKLLSAHIGAMSEVVGVISETLRQAESDGTYSRHAFM